MRLKDQGNEQSGSTPSGVRPVAVFGSRAFSLCAITQLHPHEVLRRCVVIRPQISLSLVVQSGHQFRFLKQKNTSKGELQLKTRNRPNKRSRVDLGKVHSTSLKFFPVSTGRKTASACTLRLAIGSNGQGPRASFLMSKSISSPSSVDMSSLVSGRLNTKPGGLRNSVIGCLTFTAFSGFKLDHLKCSRHGFGHGGQSLPEIRQSTAFTSRVVTKHEELGILLCTRPRLHSLHRSRLVAGGAISIETPYSLRRTCTTQAKSPIVKTFGGVGCFVGRSALRFGNVGDVLKESRGSFLGLRSVQQGHGFGTESSLKNATNSGLKTRFEMPNKPAQP